MRPLDRIRSIKWKLGILIVAAVATSAVVSTIGFRAGWPVWVRPLVSIAISLVMVQLLARGMTSPLREMAAAASAMARGDYDQAVRATSRDEVGELARAFNAMAGDLAAADRQRRDLVANVSHELRTPISALQAKLENLVDGVEPADPEVLGVMLAQTERLGRLVSQLLDLSRLESGGIPLHRRPFLVGDLLREAAGESQLNRPDVEVLLDVEPAALEVVGDPERVHQVIANLLENAVRYTPAGAPVDVRARADGDRVTITVADLGPGIPDDETSRVFERFYRADAARSSDIGGSGLGLSIASWIVDLHGGAIRAEPRAPVGCRMVVELPLG